MNYHRQVRALLRATGQSPESAPDLQSWQQVLAHLSDLMSSLDGERFRLQHSLQFHHDEVNSLYQELLHHREQLHVVAALLAEPLILLDSRGSAVLITPQATGLLGYGEHDEQAGNLLEHLGIEELLGSSDLSLLLASGRSLTARGGLQTRQGATAEVSLQLHPLEREGKLAGALLALRDANPRPQLEKLQQQASLLLTEPLLPQVESCARNILHQTEQALTFLDLFPGEKTVEEMPSVRER